MMTIESYFEKETLNEKNIDNAYKFFGYEALIKYFNKDKETINLIEKHFDNIIYKKTNANNFNSIYLSRITNTPLLSEEEEQKYGRDILLKNQINLFKDKNKLNDLGDIFISLNNDNYKDIIKYLEKLFSLSIFNADKNLKRYLEIYKQKVNILGHPLTKEELNILFENELFKDFNKYKKINDKELLEQIKFNIKYSTAKEKIFNSNLRLVLKIAYKYKNSSNNLFELVDEGCIGLMTVIDKFDITLGNKFSTYATYWIEQAIRSFVSSNSNSLKVSYKYINELKVFNKKVSELEGEFKRTLTIEELSKHLKMSPQKITEYLLYDRNKNVTSLDETIKDDSKSTYEMFLVSEDNIEQLNEKILKEEINSLFEELESKGELTPKTIKVLKLRFGIGDENITGQTLENISKEMGLTKEWIRQIEFKGLNKIKLYIRKNPKLKELKLFIK